MTAKPTIIVRCKSFSLHDRIAFSGRRHSLAFLPILLLTAWTITLVRAEAQPFASARMHKPAASTSLTVGRETIYVDFDSGSLDLSQADVLHWIDSAARAVSVYYGRFPVSGAHVLVVPRGGDRGVLEGTTWGDVRGYPAFTRMVLGEHTTAADLDADWTMTHEFVHMALPALADDHHWLEEGLATYVEPIARVQAGSLRAQQIWTGMVRDMPKGEPGPGDRGLDRTRSWANTYWGGALFCLRADVAIREKTGNRLGLQDALRGILAQANISQDWPIKRVFEVGDAATGTTVLMDLYKKLATDPSPTDLRALWTQLGVRDNRQQVTFDADAPLAPLRVAITTKPRP